MPYSKKLMLDRIIGDQTYKAALAAFAAKKARAVDVPLFEAGYGHTLQSFGNVAPYEYEDGGIGVSNGTYQLQAKLKNIRKDG